jgi:uncharacterized protein
MFQKESEEGAGAAWSAAANAPQLAGMAAPAETRRRKSLRDRDVWDGVCFMGRLYRMLTDLVQIRRLGEKQREENLRFRLHMKRHGFVERRFRKIALEFEEEMDCTACANCCRVATVKITERDVEKLARAMGLARAAFVAQYTSEEEEGLILRRGPDGCVFLSGNLCTVYEDRPRTCADFPHLVRGEGSLVKRMWEMVDRAVYCPIVYNTLEAWKEDSGFRK